jgi:peptidoglycan/LPS O-acetylase OafA/YrhL
VIPGERLRSAFSLRRNLHALLVPPAGHLRPLDGLRALSILWVVLFHAAWYSLGHVPLGTYFAELLSPWMLPFWRGDFGVDVFFVLSGFLIAGILVDERVRTGRLRLGLFYARRLLRLWPALVAAVAVDVALTPVEPLRAWANLLYVSNFLPVLRARMGWTWSLSIEEQFYLVCPWLVLAVMRLPPRVRLLPLAAIALGLCAIAAWVVQRGGYHAFDAEIVINRPLLLWARAFDDLYTKPWMRAGPLLAGVSAALVYRMPAAMQALGRRKAGPALGLLVALALGAACTEWRLVATAPRAVEIGYLASFRTLFGVSVAYVILLSLSEHPFGRGLARLLSARVLYPFSQLAYAAYLLNPIVATLVHHALSPLVQDGGSPMPLFVPCDVAATFGAAAALHLLVERPFMQLRPR